MFKQNYTQYKRLGVADAIGKIKEYMRDQDLGQADQEDEEVSVSKKLMQEAEAYYETFHHLFLPKRFKEDRHRSVLKDDYGIRRGTVKTVVAIPLPVARDMTKEEFGEAAGTF